MSWSQVPLVLNHESEGSPVLKCMKHVRIGTHAFVCTSESKYIYIHTPAVFVGLVYLPTWMVDCFGTAKVGKYKLFWWILWDIRCMMYDKYMCQPWSPSLARKGWTPVVESTFDSGATRKCFEGMAKTVKDASVLDRPHESDNLWYLLIAALIAAMYRNCCFFVSWVAVVALYPLAETTKYLFSNSWWN